MPDLTRPVAYRAARAGDTPEPSDPGPMRNVAVIVVHGMGQQVPFETLNTVAAGLIRADVRSRGGTASVDPLPRRVGLGDERLSRLELQLRGGQRVHVYETYWAPLTEGAITLRGVMEFLIRAGWRGVARGLGPFRRWVFGQEWPFPVPIRTMLHLAVAVAVVASLVVLNTAVVAVGAARMLFTSHAAWLTTGMYEDLTVVFAGLLVLFAGFGILLALRLWVQQRILRRASPPGGFLAGAAAVLAFGTVIAFVVAVAGAITSAVAAAWIFRLHAGAYRGLLLARAKPTADGIAVAINILLVVVLAAVVIRIVRSVATRLGQEERPARWLSYVTAAIVAVILVLVGVEIWFFASASSTPGASDGLAPWRRSEPLWLVLVAASAFVRRVLVQYVGDVAVYVESHTLDRYEAVRDKIRDRVFTTMRAVYAAREDGGVVYDHVVVVGHSLGSVIAYDALNRLLAEDDMARTGAADGARVDLDVLNRTALLLTFGSPLDKTAFVFALQRRDVDLGNRAGLEATLQPLIRDASFRRLPWVNIYSPWDIISGHLDCYDTPSAAPNRVTNWRDPSARTFLAAHVEYWRGTLVYRTLYETIAGGLDPARRAAPAPPPAW